MTEKDLPEIVDSAYDNGDERAFGDEVEFEIKDITSHEQARSCQMNHPETKYGCTIIGALNQIIKLFNLNLSPKEADDLGVEVVKFATQYGYKVGQGWSTPTAMNTVAKWWNTIGYERFKKEKIFYVRVDHDDKRVAEALAKGHYVGFTYQLDFGTDRFWGLVDKDSYPAGTGHRTNFQRSEDVDTASKKKYTDTQLGVHDNYHGWVNEYYIKDITKYINKGMYPAVYLVMPESWKDGATVEEEKKVIKEIKAVNALVGVLSSTYQMLPEEIKPQLADLAKTLREKYPEARKLVEDEDKKVYQMVVDILSYAWKFADEGNKEMYAKLAESIRKDKGVL